MKLLKLAMSAESEELLSTSYMPPVSLIKSISAGPLEKKSSFPCSVWLF
jgi:hypothetical protein